MRMHYRRFLATLFLLLIGVFPAPAGAHVGPAYPILVEKKAGLYTISVWADPDVGVGTFYVQFKGSPGSDVGVSVTVQPMSKRLPEATYTAEPKSMNNSVQYQAKVPFDQEEPWRVRFHIIGSQGAGDAETTVEVTPDVLGPWGIALYLFPFLLIAFLWLRGFLSERRRQAANRLSAPAPAPDPTIESPTEGAVPTERPVIGRQSP